jgi:hypothetical protein
MLRCDPYRDEFYVGESTEGVAPGYHMYPLRG